MPKLPSNIKLNKNNLHQIIDLKKVYGFDLSHEQQQVVGQEMIDIILDRAEKNVDIFGSKFKAYSKEYVGSDDFKDFNKSKRDINIEMTGRLLDSVDFEVQGDKLRLFVSPKESPKGYNHLVGDTVPQRAWFGVTDKELMKVKPEEPSRQTILDIATLDVVEAVGTEAAFNDLLFASSIEFTI